MNHNEAMQLSAAERYAMGELPADVREAYEEHFFDCAECAMDIQAVSAFADGAREVFANEAPVTAWQPGRSTGRGWWSRVLQPLVAVPVFGALLLTIGYQNLQTIPQLKAQASSEMQLVHTFSLATADSRGGAAVPVTIQRGESAAVYFDIPPGLGFAGYLCKLEDAAGHVLRQVRVSSEQANKSIELLLPAGMMRTGTYSIVITGETEPGGQPLDQQHVDPLNFEVSFE